MKSFVIRAVVAAFALSTAAFAEEARPGQAQAAPEANPLRHLLDPPPSTTISGKDIKVKLPPREAGSIARATGAVLTQGHYRQTALDNDISRTFFTNYLSALDYSRLVFTQTDIDEFGKRYAEQLDDLTKAGDASPAFEIFRRYLERLEERNTFAQKLLEQSIDFSTDERFNPQRDKTSWPADTAAAEDLWRLRVKFDVLQGRLAKDKPEEVVSKLSKRYSRLLKTMKDYDDEEILSAYLTSLANAYDPHSDYMSPSEAKQFEIQNVKLSLTGIGALLEWDDGYTRVKSLVPGGPAERSKQLKPKDRIVAVSQGDEEAVDVVEMRLNKVVELIRGKKGSEVRLTIVPAESEDGSKREVRIIRDDVPLAEQHAKARIVDLPTSTGHSARLGVVILPQFYENCARDVEKLIQRLQDEKVEGLVLDLRRNGGGILEEAIELTGLFIREGPVVQVKNHNGATRVLEDENPKVTWEGPLVVAVGHLSASASEIVAAALQDYGRALVVGDAATHGKGTVQTLVPLAQFFDRGRVGANAGKLKFTVSKFYRIAGGTTQKYGVTPDIQLPSVLDYMELGESYLPNCLPADRTTPLDFGRMDEVQPFLTTLRDRSLNRVAASREFAFIVEDIEEMKKRKQDPSVSLNEEKRLAEKSERKAREETRKEERKNIDSTPVPIHELTLEAVTKGEPAKLLSNKTSSTSTAPTAPAVEGAVTNATTVAAAPATTSPSSSNAEDEDAEDETAENRLEPQLRETLNVLNDYLDLLAAKGNRWVMDHRAPRN
ncbi:MAG: carboxy terminal-processing peptidase [Verrucomicrobiales bacterium]|nr:carboxy terminal-processing peptidase [Verrucomicrobiales bacterium]